MKTKQVVAFLMAATLAVTSGGVSTLASQNAADAQQKEAAIEESLEGDDAKAGDDAEADAKDDAEAEGEAAEDEVAAESQQQEDTEESLEGDDTEAKAEAAADEDAAEALQEETAIEESIRVDEAEGEAAVSDNGLRMVAELGVGDKVLGLTTDEGKGGGLEQLLEVEQDKADKDEATIEKLNRCITALKDKVTVDKSPEQVEYGENVTFTINWDKMDSNVTIKSLALVRITDEGTQEGIVVDAKNGDDYKEQWSNNETTLSWNAVEDKNIAIDKDGWTLPRDINFKVRAIVVYNNDAPTAWYDLPTELVNVKPADPNNFIESVIKKLNLGEIEISEDNAKADKDDEESLEALAIGEGFGYPYNEKDSDDIDEVNELIKQVGAVELYKKIKSLSDEFGAYKRFVKGVEPAVELKSLQYTPDMKTVPVKFVFDGTKCEKPAGATKEENGKYAGDYALTVNVPVTIVQKAMKVDIKAYVDGIEVKSTPKDKDGKVYHQYNLKLNGHLTLQADVLPKNLADDSVGWKKDPGSYVTFIDTESANKKIVKADKKGSTKVTATANDGGGASYDVIIASNSGVATSDIDFSFFPATKEYKGDAKISEYLYDELHKANDAVEGVGKYEIERSKEDGTLNDTTVVGRNVADDGIREDGSGYVYKYEIKFTLDDENDAVEDANSKKWSDANGTKYFVKPLSLCVTPATITEEKALSEIVKEEYSEQGTTLTVDLGTTLDGLVNQSAKLKYTIRWYEANGTTPVNGSGVALPIGTSTYVLKYDEGPNGEKWGANSDYAGYKLDDGSHAVTFTITVKDPELKAYADTPYPHPDKYKNGSVIKLYAFKDTSKDESESFVTSTDPAKAWNGIYDITVTWVKDAKTTISNGDIVREVDENGDPKKDEQGKEIVYYYKDAYWLKKKAAQNNNNNPSDSELSNLELVLINEDNMVNPNPEQEKKNDELARSAFKGFVDSTGEYNTSSLPLKVTSASEGTYTAVVEANINDAGRNSAWFSSLDLAMQQKYARLTATSSKEVKVTDILFGEDAVTIFDPNANETQIKNDAKIHLYDKNGVMSENGGSVTLTYGDTASKKLNVRVKAKDIVSYDVCYTDKKGDEHVVQTFNVTDEGSKILFEDGSLIGEGYKGVSIGNLDAGDYDFYVRVRTVSDTATSGKLRIKVNKKTISDAFFDSSLITVEPITYGQNYNTAKVSCADAAIDSEVQFKVKEDQIAKKTGPVTVTVVVANMNDIKNYDLSGKWQFKTVLDVVAYPVTVTALDKTCEAGPVPAFTDADWTANIPEEILAINGDTVASVLDVKLTVQKNGAQTAFVTAGTYDIVPVPTPKSNNFSIEKTEYGTLTVTGGTGSDIETNDIQFNKKQIVFTNIGKTREFAAAVVPATESNAGLTFESDNESVATVEVTDAENGKAVVTAVANGEANIVVTAPNGVSKSLHVTVKQEPKKVVISRSGKTVSRTISVSVGKKYDFDAKVQPSTVFKKGVTWSTSNAKIATVGKKGKVTVKAAGTVKITATAKGGAKSKTITLKAK